VEVRLQLLGSPIVAVDGRTVAFDTRKAVALLALLVATGAPVSRERLAGLLWPESPNARARSALRRTLSVTVAAVGPAVRADRQAVWADHAALWCDVVEFQARASGELSDLQEAAALYRGDFLAGFGLRDSGAFEDWAAGVADGLRRAFAGLLQRLSAALVAEGRIEQAVEPARRWLQVDPLHEPAHQLLIQLYGWSGQRSAALRQYRDCVRILDRELAVAPLPETTACYDAVRRGRLPAPPRPARAPQPSPPPSEARTPALLPLAGRAGELGVLRAARAAVDGAGRVVAVAGEAGSGKSRLLAALTGGPVLRGRAYQGEDGLPFAVVAELLRAATAGGGPAVPAAALAEVGRLVPELSGAADVAPLDSPGALARLYEAVTGVLRATLAGRPAGVLVVDDAQWLDDASAAYLAWLIRRLDRIPLLVVLAWTAEADAPPLRAAVADAARAGLGRLLPLGPLDEPAVAELIAAAGVSGLPPAVLLAETRGLPMLVTEYVGAYRSGTPPGPDGLPVSVRDLLAPRIAAVGEPAGQVLAAVAVLGGHAEADLVRATSGRGEEETVDALDALLAARLLVERADGPRPGYLFPYEALRRVALDVVSLARRRLLHRRAAEALAHRGDPDVAAVIATHLRLAGRDGEAAGWAWAAAARARELYAHTAARRHLEEALALGHPVVEASLALGDVLTVLGHYAAAVTAYERAGAAADIDPATRGAVEHRLAEVRHRTGDWAAAEEHLAAALELPLPEPARARVLADRALLAYRQGDLAAADARAGKALVAARGCADATALAQALDVAGVVAAGQGRSAQAERLLTESLQHAAGDVALQVAALNNLARVLADAGRLDRALEAGARALELGETYGDRHRTAALHTNLADLLHAGGRSAEAMAHQRAAAGLFADVDREPARRPEIWKLVAW